MATKLLALPYRMHGHAGALVLAVVEGVGQVDRVEATVKRVPETMPEDAARIGQWPVTGRD